MHGLERDRHEWTNDRNSTRGRVHLGRHDFANWREQLFALEDGFGLDVAMVAVGITLTFTTATQVVRPDE